ncbi:MAG: SWF/SNF helicase family protein, partial [Ignavibacteria bacterium]|nr:SWF/SNF helicase family protein [Ignavibacteria bacterium]
ATPFNNKPEDVLSLLKLFIIPKKSAITLDPDLSEVFRTINTIFTNLAFIKKNFNSTDRRKAKTAQVKYKAIFGDDEIDLNKINRKTHELARQIRDVIEPITIRRNRLDLIKNPFYQNEVTELSEVDDPIEWFYELTPDQSAFYDEIITKYFEDPGKGGMFKGAIYLPFLYEEGLKITAYDDSIEDREKNREFLQQRNLFDIMRRMIVKRFESSFGAFEQTIKRFKEINETVLKFIEKTGNGDPLKGEYILDRKLMNDIVELSSDEIEEELKEYERQITAGVYPKKHKRYKLENFKSASEFIEDIKSDIKLFDEVLEKLESFKLIENDPKTECLLKNLLTELNKKPNPDEPKRKIIIFSEYADTVQYVYDKLSPELRERTLVVTGSISNSAISEINRNFDASVNNQKDNYDILLSTDKLSEGFNLNRAGIVINYDIPWNPVRVIQRLGRINRISKKVFDKLYIVNFFPTEKGAELVRSREIAQNKMFIIHNTLGEDSKIFDIDEEPTPAALYQRLTKNPDTNEEESFYTKTLSLYIELINEYPDLENKLSSLPKRIKVAKKSTEDNMIVCFVKNRMHIAYAEKINDEIKISETLLENILEKIKCEPDEKALEIDDEFWEIYESVRQSRRRTFSSRQDQSIEGTALTKLRALLKSIKTDNLNRLESFIRTLIEDIIDYGTLPDYTLRRLANLEFNDGNIDKALEVIEAIKNELGEDYLEKIKNKLGRNEKEIIVAIRNRKIS